jgi:hypothetical protein
MSPDPKGGAVSTVALAPNLAPTYAQHAEPWIGIQHGHGLATLAGHVVRRTWFDGRPHADVAVTVDYGEALEIARRVRAEQGAAGYAVIDSLHQCGCRELG